MNATRPAAVAGAFYPGSRQTLSHDVLALLAAARPEAANATLPKALLDLMRRDKATEQDVMLAVAQKGYYPQGTPIAAYAPDFVEGVLIAAWPQVYSVIQANREKVPF